MLASNRKWEANVCRSATLQDLHGSNPSLRGAGELEGRSQATRQKDQHTHFEKVIEQKNSFYHLALPLEKTAPGALNSMINGPPPDLYCSCKSHD